MGGWVGGWGFGRRTLKQCSGMLLLISERVGNFFSTMVVYCCVVYWYMKGLYCTALGGRGRDPSAACGGMKEGARERGEWRQRWARSLLAAAVYPWPWRGSDWDGSACDSFDIWSLTHSRVAAGRAPTHPKWTRGWPGIGQERGTSATPPEGQRLRFWLGRAVGGHVPRA